MKKTTLYKLIQQALREIIYESKDSKLKKEYKPKGGGLNKKEITKISNDLLKEQLKQSILDSPIGLPTFSKIRIKEINNFLSSNYLSGVPLKEISNNPLLKDINIDGLKAVYKDIPTLTEEEFIELLPLLLEQTSCSSINSYGSIYVYDDACNISGEITDKFICCSLNNSTTSGAGGNLITLNINGGGTLNISMDNDCYDMAAGASQSTNQFTYADLTDYIAGTGNNQGAGDASVSTAMQNVWLNGVMFTSGIGGNQDCVGCAHPSSIGGTLPYDISNMNMGCPDQEMMADPTNLSCCGFSGCGAINTYPPADNPTSDITATISGNITLTAVADEEQPYWTNTPNSCTWSSQCTQQTITVATVNYTSINGPGYGPWAGVGEPSNYAYQGVASTSSPYVTTTTSITDDDSCEIVACADVLLAGATDQLGNILQTNYIGITPAQASGFILTDCGNDTTWVNPDTNTVESTSECCNVTACGDDDYDNYIAANTFGTHSVTTNNTLCENYTSGCTNDPWTAYSISFNQMDYSCTYNGCTDPLSYLSEKYVCALYPSLCLFDPNYTAGTPSTSTTACTCTAGAANCSECVPHGAPYADTNHPDAASVVGNVFVHNQNECTGIGGCMDNGNPITNSNFDSNAPGAATTNTEWWTGVGPNTWNYTNTYTTILAYNHNVAANNYNAINTEEDGSCKYDNWGCNDNTYCNYDINVTTNDGSCSGTIGCINDSAASNHTTDSANAGSYAYQFANYDPSNTFGCDAATTLCYECVYGCTDPLSSNQDILATCNNGTCTACIDGCMESNYVEYDASYTCDDFVDASTPGSYCSTICVDGCTDSLAINYNALATCDDGTCTYTTGCTDSLACNTTPGATQDDGSCEYTSCAGCMDDGTSNPGTDRVNHPLFTASVAACNNQDGGSTTYTISDPTACTYTSCVGCTNDTYCNYNDTATVNDGCAGTMGCTDPTACNEVSGASCADPSNPCKFDDCNGDCGGTASTGCRTDNTTGAYSTGCCDGTTAFTCVSVSGCDSLCGSTKTVDCNFDCGGTASTGCRTDASGVYSTGCRDGLTAFTSAALVCGDCGGTASTGCRTDNITGAYSTGCCDGTTDYTCVALDCASLCGGATPQDDCGVCNPNNDGTTSGGLWNASCTGCNNVLTSTTLLAYADLDNAIPTTYDASNTLGMDSCVFNYCWSSTVSQGTVNNYACSCDTNNTVGCDDFDGYKLCEDASSNQCIASCPTGTPIAALGTFPSSQSPCDILAYGCMDAGSSHTWTSTGTTYGPYIESVNTNSGNNVGEAINYDAATLIACDDNCVSGPDGVMQTFGTGLATDNPYGCCCSYKPGCITDATPPYLEYNSLYTHQAPTGQGNYCNEEAVVGCTTPGFDQYNPLANFDDESCKYDGCIDNGNHYTAANQLQTSPWENYVCLNSDPAPNMSGPNTSIGELLCNCVGFGTGVGQCDSSSEYIGYGTFMDSDPAITTVTDYDYYSTPSVDGSCNQTPFTTYECVAPQGTCVATTGGTYNSNTCNNNCTPDITYDCDPILGCTNPGTGLGFHTGTSALTNCQAACTQCTEVTAEKCYSNTSLSFGCNGSGYDGLLIDGQHGNPLLTGTSLNLTSEYGIGQVFKRKENTDTQQDIGVLSEQQSLDPDAGYIWVSYEVTSIQTKYQNYNNLRDLESSKCTRRTWDCCTMATCPEIFDEMYGPASSWAYNNPNSPTPTINWSAKFCKERFDNSGQYTSLGGKTGCNWLCKKGEEWPGKNLDGKDLDNPREISKTCQCCDKFGQSISMVQKVPASTSCHTLNGSIISGAPVSNCHTSPISGGPNIPCQLIGPDEEDKTLIDPRAGGGIPKNININTIEPTDLNKSTNPTPYITPSTPELKESKKLRKLIKKWRKNNL